MRYVILGAGAIGGTFGGHLHRVGREVVLVARAAHVAAIRAGGLRLLTGDGDYRLNVPAVDAVGDAGPFDAEDVVLLTCKAQHTVAALGELRAAGAPAELPVVCCQNAIWNETHAQRVFRHRSGGRIAKRAAQQQGGHRELALGGTGRTGAARPAGHLGTPWMLPPPSTPEPLRGLRAATAAS